MSGAEGGLTVTRVGAAGGCDLLILIFGRAGIVEDQKIAASGSSYTIGVSVSVICVPARSVPVDFHKDVSVFDVIPIRFKRHPLVVFPTCAPV
jgi:hypothetical protein